MKQASEKKFPLSAKDYKLCEEIGEGVSATVYRALCLPRNESVAIKVLDLEKCNNDLDGIRREVQTMILTDHPNVLQAHCSFTEGHSLWVVMPFMGGGSCLHIMKSAYPEGFEEPVIATVLYEVLKALVYLHAHGHIHRDVKAGNILIDTNGSVRLADFGVAACMFDSGDRQRSRNTFVGTPCWMAPEVMQQLHGYDFKADIWSLGITALELAHGHAPFSKYPPMKVLLMTLQNAPPGLDYERDKRFSKSFRDLVGACLVKDPKKRPSSEKLLKHPFFKHAKSADYVSRAILEGLSPLAEGFRILKAKDADLLIQNKSLYEDKEHLSQQEYIRGVSAWNFNLDDLRNQAALIQDDPISSPEDSSVSWKHIDGQNGEMIYPNQPNNVNATSLLEDELNDIDDLENSFAAFPIKPLQALKGCFDVCEDDNGAVSPNSRDSVHLDSEQQSQQQSLTSAVDQESVRDHAVLKKVPNLDSEQQSQQQSLTSAVDQESVRDHAVLKKVPSISLLQENNVSAKRFNGDGDRENMQPRYQMERNCSGPLQNRQRKDFNYCPPGEDASEGAVVERRGRFKVTSADVNLKDPVNHVNSMSGGSTLPTVPTISTASVLQSLHCLLQQNTTKRDAVLKMIEFVEQTSGNASESTEMGTTDVFQMNPCSAKERELQAQVFQMQQRIGGLVEELQRLKTKNAQFERSHRKEDRIQE